MIRYFARYYANIVTQMSYKLVNPWLPWQYGNILGGQLVPRVFAVPPRRPWVNLYIFDVDLITLIQRLQQYTAYLRAICAVTIYLRAETNNIV